MVKLFKTGKLTVGRAAELAGYSKTTFIELLGKSEIPVINYPPEEFRTGDKLLTKEALTNNTCLIELEGIGRLDLLSRVFSKIFAPPMVATEIQTL